MLAPPEYDHISETSSDAVQEENIPTLTTPTNAHLYWSYRGVQELPEPQEPPGLTYPALLLALQSICFAIGLLLL